MDALANLPKPATWDDHKLTEATRHSIVIRAMGTATFDPNLPDCGVVMLRSEDNILDQLEGTLRDGYP